MPVTTATLHLVYFRFFSFSLFSFLLFALVNLLLVIFTKLNGA